ncbi:MAG: hypothetical protein V1875_01815 [Candidatus Altiarchaeota archaeon]
MISKVSRGQGAMEYLMTYGWAILVVMVVGIVMWQLGIFNLNQGSTTATGFAKIKPQLAGSGFVGSGAVTNFIFTNGAGGRVRIQSVAMEDIANPGGGTAACTGGAALQSNSASLIDGNADAASVVVDQGENLRISDNTCLAPAIAGEVYNARIRINYVVTVVGQRSAHTEAGILRGPVE